MNHPDGTFHIDPDAEAEAATSQCVSCGAVGLVPFYEVDGVPVQTSVLLESSADAKEFPTGDVLLALCERCELIQNIRFDTTLIDYSMPTEESQAFSPRFAEFAAALADHLVTKHRLAGKSVLEIGCGKGDFLALLAQRGIGSGLGVDPGFLPNRQDVDGGVLSFIREWYGSAHTSLTGDLVAARHLMEHVPNVGEFFGWLAESLAATPGGTLYVEVPDSRRILTEGAFWDVYYEHCSYFTHRSLFDSIGRSGLSVTVLTSGFDGQYLLSEAMHGSEGLAIGDIGPTGSIGSDVANFAASANRQITAWRRRLQEVVSDGSPVAIWGGGSKAVSFLASIGVREVTVVDINPIKQGKWLPGVAVRIDAPHVLKRTKPDLVIAMNAVYLGEIEADLAGMGLKPVLTAV